MSIVRLTRITLLFKIKHFLFVGLRGMMSARQHK